MRRTYRKGSAFDALLYLVLAAIIAFGLTVIVRDLAEYTAAYPHCMFGGAVCENPASQHGLLLIAGAVFAALVVVWLGIAGLSALRKLIVGGR